MTDLDFIRALRNRTADPCMSDVTRLLALLAKGDLVHVDEAADVERHAGAGSLQPPEMFLVVTVFESCGFGIANDPALNIDDAADQVDGLGGQPFRVIRITADLTTTDATADVLAVIDARLKARVV